MTTVHSPRSSITQELKRSIVQAKLNGFGAESSKSSVKPKKKALDTTKMVPLGPSVRQQELQRELKRNEVFRTMAKSQTRETVTGKLMMQTGKKSKLPDEPVFVPEPHVEPEPAPVKFALQDVSDRFGILTTSLDKDALARAADEIHANCIDSNGVISCSAEFFEACQQFKGSKGNENLNQFCGCYWSDFCSPECIRAAKPANHSCQKGRCVIGINSLLPGVPLSTQCGFRGDEAQRTCTLDDVTVGYVERTTGTNMRNSGACEPICMEKGKQVNCYPPNAPPTHHNNQSNAVLFWIIVGIIAFVIILLLALLLAYISQPPNITVTPPPPSRPPAPLVVIE